MKPVPRLLPLVAVAVGGVLAVKALAGAADLPDLLSAAQARAEAAPAKAAAKPAAQTATAAAPKPPPVCAPSLSELAKEASLSPAELQTLQSLQARRGQLDQREKDMDLKLQLLAAAEMKLDGKLRALQALKGEMQGLMGQGDTKTQGEVDRLVKVYEKMKPRDAGAIMATLDDRVRIPVAAKMKEAALAAILAQMPTLEAKKLTESLARRYAPADKIAQQALGKAPAPAASAPSVDPLTDPADAEAQDASPAKAKAPPRRLARRAAAPKRKAVPTPVIMPPAAPAGGSKPPETARAADPKSPPPKQG